MRNDYAKYLNSTKRQSSRSLWFKRLAVFFIVFILLASLGFVYYFKPTTNVFAKQEQQPEQIKDLNIKFSFYTDLPSLQVGAVKTPIPAVTKTQIQTIAVKKAPKPIVEKKSSGHFMVQIAAYKNSSSASDKRISLLFEGFEAKIVESNKNGRKIYHLQQGPYQDLSKARLAQRKLEKRGIKSVIKKTTT